MLKFIISLLLARQCMAVLKMSALQGFASVALSSEEAHAGKESFTAACCRFWWRAALRIIDDTAESHDPRFPADLHPQVLLRHAAAMQESLAKGA